MRKGILLVCTLLSLILFGQSTKESMKTEKITIEIWSDIVCPFCFVGKKKMEKAIATLKAEDQVEIIWRSFQLDPDFPTGKSISTNEYLVQRKGYPKEQVARMTAQLVESGKGYGIDFNFDKARSFNTLNAHRLIHWANEEGKSNELKEALMISYFSEGLDLSVTENLLSVLENAGLDMTKAKEVLESDAYTAEVNQDISKARTLGVSGVPYFVLNGEAAISGAQNDEVFENTLAAALKNLKPEDDTRQEGICVPDEGCK